MLSVHSVRNVSIAWKWISVREQIQKQQKLTRMQFAFQSTAVNAKDQNVYSKSFVNSLNNEWQKALPSKAIPGLSRYELVRGFMKGGQFADFSLNDLLLKGRERFGNIYRMPGVFGQPPSLVLFNFEDFEKVFRTEGSWPVRPGGEVITHYRQMRKDGFFNERIGLAGHGEDWGKFRHTVNPILMQPKNARLYLGPMQKVNLEFIQR
ncbi:PREDICTED: probable cytochrome P450 12c1, mitochondrial [Rhagoletis zephyria]|uniref:probable cytochrome P450 12c1, mitochondrial n=1 Tax=Rhagoletis zephyria TaxID=28612 RepID=UPI0008114CF1|nr:PREDICTED: probable cytochrome P450 12c1, mitochondrial [Rhagoletis zephyria]